jgi:hypothetical protein
MAREDWRDLEADRLRRLRDHDRDDRGRDDRVRDRDDYGQADYSNLYGYDPVHRTGYRAYDDGRPLDQRAGYYSDRPNREEWDYGPDRRRARRDGPSDRVLWAVIMERLDDDRRVDLRDVEVDVRDGEVTLNGHVRNKTEKRRIEDIADIEGVRHVQNNLRVREHRRWMFL